MLEALLKILVCVMHKNDQTKSFSKVLKLKILRFRSHHPEMKVMKRRRRLTHYIVAKLPDILLFSLSVRNLRHFATDSFSIPRCFNTAQTQSRL